jgi:AraC family transcriptional regulator, positive regulator of tynA and feaB
VSATVFETTEVACGERLFRWSQMLATLCGPLKILGYNSDSIDGRIETATVGRLKLSRIVASSHKLELTDEHLARQAAVKIVLQLRGTSIFEQGGTQVYVNAGDCFGYDVSRPHSIVSPTHTEHLVVVVPQDLAASYDLRAGHAGARRFAAHRGIGHITRQLVETSLEGAFDFDPDAAEQVSDLLLGSLRLSLRGARAGSLVTSRSSLLARAKAYIDEHLSDPDLDVAGIAKALSCSKRFLHLAFAEQGVSVNEYLWSLRLERCRRDLMKGIGSASLTELAFAWGFSSSSHFSRSFKRRFGMSPSAMLVKHHRAET